MRINITRKLSQKDYKQKKSILSWRLLQVSRHNQKDLDNKIYKTSNRSKLSVVFCFFHILFFLLLSSFHLSQKRLSDRLSSFLFSIQYPKKKKSHLSISYFFIQKWTDKISITSTHFFENIT